MYIYFNETDKVTLSAHLRGFNIQIRQVLSMGSFMC